MELITLLKYLQKTKWVSRREFEQMVLEKVIYLNWELVTNFDQTVNLGDKLEIKLPEWVYEEVIKRLPMFRPVIVAFNKPKWYAVSKEDKHNKIIYELLPKSWLNDFYYIWRLDKESHGLLLLTNDPQMVDFYENPKNRVLKIYEVIIDKPLRSKDIIKMKKWVNVDEEWTLIDATRKNPIEPVWKVELLAFYDIHYLHQEWRHVLRILLDEWKKRHIRRLLKAFEYKVRDLKRIKVWKYELGDLKPGKYKIYKN